MKYIIYLAFPVIFSVSPCWAETSRSPTEIVELRMAAFNEHRLTDFLSYYSDEIQVFDYPDQAIGKKGKKHLEQVFAPLFAEKAVHSDVHQIIENGNYVVVHETVVRREKTTDYISIYKITNELITDVRFIRN